MRRICFTISQMIRHQAQIIVKAARFWITIFTGFMSLFQLQCNLMPPYALNSSLPARQIYYKLEQIAGAGDCKRRNVSGHRFQERYCFLVCLFICVLLASKIMNFVWQAGHLPLRWWHCPNSILWSKYDTVGTSVSCRHTCCINYDIDNRSSSSSIHK